jgi:hypothetical protein
MSEVIGRSLLSIHWSLQFELPSSPLLNRLSYLSLQFSKTVAKFIVHKIFFLHQTWFDKISKTLMSVAIFLA